MALFDDTGYMAKVEERRVRIRTARTKTADPDEEPVTPEPDEEQGPEADEWQRPTFKDCAAADIDLAFFNMDEHADEHGIDDKGIFLVIFEDDDLRRKSSHWEGGAKQNFDTGLYTAHSILYIRVSDYGPKPKIGKQLVLDKGTENQRTFTILQCREESGVYRMTLERVRQ